MEDQKRLVGILIASLCGVAVSGLFASCKFQKEATQVKSFVPDLGWWQGERETRQKKLDKYLKDNNVAFTWFRDFPVGTSGMPFMVMRALPKIFSEELGGQNFEAIGLGQHPTEENRPAPLGIGWARMSQAIVKVPILDQFRLRVGALSCSACHVGRVQGPDGKTIYLYGGPNTQFDAPLFSSTIEKIVEDERFNFENFIKILNTSSGEPLGWLYGNNPLDKAWELAERKLFEKEGEKILLGIKAKVLAKKARLDKFHRKLSYANDNSPAPEGGAPGSMDAFGAGLAILAPENTPLDQLPQSPSPVDIMSVWRQSDRKYAQWTAGMKEPMYRNLGAELGIIGIPSEVNVENSHLTSGLLGELPSPPYPFDVDRELAERGKVLFETHCVSCHKPKSDGEVFTPEQTGTDAARIGMFTKATREVLIKGLQEACSDASKCPKVSDDEILRVETGYMATPLDGIWARAPYLHNGSVPTLRHLLVPELRRSDDAKKFWRGNTTYDTQNVGFVWRKQDSKYAKHVDFSKNGLSNAGHVGRFLRQEGEGVWGGEELEALLEHLKTL